MFVAFLESIKYVGHLLPITFLRIFMGYFYLQQAMEKYEGDFLIRPRLASTIAEWLPTSHAPIWYRVAIESYVIPNWQLFSYFLIASQVLIAFSYVVGFLVRPVALWAVFLCMNLLFLSGPEQEIMYKTFLAIHVVFAWLGAGRCLGFDYYFYKRRRGLWW